MKELKLIHITKCGGTSIENIGKKNGKLWGTFHKEYACNSCSHSHTVFKYINKEIQLKYDWFTVVRNPYERILSEFYCKWGGIGSYEKSIPLVKEECNKFLISKIKNYNGFGYHYTPQFFYLENDYNIDIKILRLENLKEDFNNLMKDYDYDINLTNHDNKSNKRSFKISDFSEELIDLINVVYKKDFELFGYKMMDFNKEKEDNIQIELEEINLNELDIQEKKIKPQNIKKRQQFKKTNNFKMIKLI
jgi:hypothetical protein